MLSFDIRSLEHQAVTVDDVLSPDDPVWQEDDPKPAAPIHVTGRLSTAGAGRYYWHGHLEGDVTMECRRCLEDARAHVTGDEHVIFADADDEETDDPDVYRLAPQAQEIDLRPVVREQWLLAVPAYVLCREDCQGLCPSCGADLNLGNCDCPPVTSTDARWDALKSLVTKAAPEEKKKARRAPHRDA
jgi:uncharacterized protein